MYVNIRRYTGTSSAHEIYDRVRAEFVPRVSQIRGYRDYYLVDAGGGVVVTVSVFDDKSGADESARAAAEWIKTAGLSEALPNAPEITSGERVI